MELGKVIIEYNINDNTIRVYNSVNVCSLLINDKVVDRYLGTVAFTFNLSGKLKIDEKTFLLRQKWVISLCDFMLTESLSEKPLWVWRDFLVFHFNCSGKPNEIYVKSNYLLTNE